MCVLVCVDVPWPGMRALSRLVSMSQQHQLVAGNQQVSRARTRCPTRRTALPHWVGQPGRGQKKRAGGPPGTWDAAKADSTVASARLCIQGGVQEGSVAAVIGLQDPVKDC
jgi:hypothetical protein